LHSSLLNAAHVTAVDVRTIGEILFLAGYSEKHGAPVVHVGAHSTLCQNAVTLHNLLLAVPNFHCAALKNGLLCFTRTEQFSAIVKWRRLLGWYG
jgi:hypothetical protein